NLANWLHIRSVLHLRLLKPVHVSLYANTINAVVTDFVGMATWLRENRGQGIMVHNLAQELYKFAFEGDANRQINDLKFKLVKAEQEVTALEQNVTRMEGQVTRYKSASENAEKVEDELKAEKRKLQRELRSALDKADELESNNSHLCKRLEKMKSSRGAA
ncbi:hypothetical protein CRUP_030878, partial [Coryphaenoides rupestris]